MKAVYEISFLLILTTICTMLMWAGHQMLEHRGGSNQELIKAAQAILKNSQKISLLKFSPAGPSKDIFTLQSSPEICFTIKEGTGMWGQIRICIGANLRTGKVLGIRILAQQETPGLGARISEKPFWQQFAGLSFNQDIHIVSAPVHKNEIDGITGATISSKAVEQIVNRAMRKMHATIQRTQE